MEAKAIVALTRDIDKENRTFRAVASTGSLDRDREVIQPGAFDDSLADFMANPVLLAQHNYRSADGRPTIIGRVLNVESTDDGYEIEARMANTALAEEWWTLIRDGDANALSVGFIPQERVRARDFDDAQKEQWAGAEAVHTRAELVEISAVAVPSNRDALVRRAAKGMQLAEQLTQQLDDTRLATCGDLTTLRESMCEQFARAVGDIKEAITQVQTSPDTKTETIGDDSDERPDPLASAVA